MTTTRMNNLTIHENLVVVHINGYDTPPETVIDEETGAEFEVPASTLVDPPGSANWLCEQYGMSDGDNLDLGILWTDYDSACDEPWRFSVLLDADESDELQDFAREAGYEILSVEPVTEPTNYGDGGGTCEILKHRDGWVILGR